MRNSRDTAILRHDLLTNQPFLSPVGANIFNQSLKVVKQPKQKRITYVLMENRSNN